MQLTPNKDVSSYGIFTAKHIFIICVLRSMVKILSTIGIPNQTVSCEFPGLIFCVFRERFFCTSAASLTCTFPAGWVRSWERETHVAKASMLFSTSLLDEIRRGKPAGENAAFR